MSKPRNGGQWTDGRFRSFIMSTLRSASKRWGPRAAALSAARLRRGVYECAVCKREMQATEWKPYKSKAKLGQMKKVKHPQMDHIEPVIDPAVGFVSWDEVVARLFVEQDGWQAICYECHEAITAQEREERKRAKSNPTKLQNL